MHRQSVENCRGTCKLLTLSKASLYILHLSLCAAFPARAAARLDLRPILSSSAFTLGERETGSVGSEAAWFSHPSFSPSPSSLSFCWAADGLICSLEPSGSGENYFFMFLLRREGEGLPGAMAGRGEESWEACWDGPEEVFSCFSPLFLQAFPQR